MDGHTPATSVINVSVTFLAAGRARFRTPFSSRSSRRGLGFPVTVALIDHPRAGLTLVDTGLGDAYFQALRRFPAQLFHWFLDASPAPEGSVAVQLQQLGLQLERILLTHLHPDHIGGLRDLLKVFPKAEVLLSAEALRAAEQVSGSALWTRLLALRRGLLPGLFPLEALNARRLRLTDNLHWKKLQSEWAPFDQAVDLFEDGSVQLIRLPGHAVGQLGVLLRTDQGFTLLGADAAWSTRAVQQQRVSLGIAQMIMHDRREERTLLSNLADLAQRRPEVRMLFSHGRETQALVSSLSGNTHGEHK